MRLALNRGITRSSETPFPRLVNSQIQSTAICIARCAYHLPGWKTKVCTKDARTRQQREADRKIRQLEKLPRVEALPDFQYPYEKTVLSDYMFQYPLYENELDTPQLFNLTPPPNFFLYWNVSDFDRTAYPPVPQEDHRLLLPKPSDKAWLAHRLRAMRYLAKHEIVPHFIPQTHFDVNLSVVFPGTYSTRAKAPPSSSSAVNQGTATVKALSRRNFWFTAHCGNYIELTDVQHPPSVFFTSPSSSGSSGTDEEYYTLLMVSPDYPYRIPAYDDKSASRGFFVHYMVSNLRPSSVSQTSSSSSSSSPVVSPASGGDVVIPYVAPLPTEDAGTTRHVFLLYRQTHKVASAKSTAKTEEWERQHFPLALRSNFRLHDESRAANVAFKAIYEVEQSIAPEPRAITFFLTKWDIQVQEYYERIGHPEPAAPMDEMIEALLEFHASKPEANRIRSRHRPDGSTNVGDDPQFWGQREPTRMMDGSMQSLWSRRTSMGSNGVPVTYPH